VLFALPLLFEDVAVALPAPQLMHFVVLLFDSLAKLLLLLGLVPL